MRSGIMREAADNGMEYLVMEVSSQAYKVDRVFGLTFRRRRIPQYQPGTISAPSSIRHSRITSTANVRS